MARRKIKSNDIILKLDMSGGTTYSLIVCLEDQSFPRSRSVVDAKSKCGPDKSLGQLEIGDIDFSGQIIYSPTSTEVSIAALNAAILANTVVGWSWGEAVPTTGSVTYSGTCGLSKLDEKAGTDDISKFSASLTVYGNYTTVVTA